MNKRILCLSATILCGLLAIVITFSQKTIAWFWHDNKSVSAILLMLGAIFGSQWLDYERRYHSTRPVRPDWVRRLLYTGLLLGCTSQSWAQCWTGNIQVYAPDPSAIAVSDFNGDGFADMAVVSTEAHSVLITLGHGDGTFGGSQASVHSYLLISSPVAIAVGHFNNDAKPDLVIVNQGANKVSVLLNTGGGGTFGPPTAFDTGKAPSGVAVADFNKDGKADLAVTNQSGNTVSILYGFGGGYFLKPDNFFVGFGPTSVAIRDFNGDGKLDLVVANFLVGNVAVLPGTATGFGPPTFYPTGGAGGRAVVSRDLNGDGKPDLAVVNQSSANVSILMNNGGVFSQPTLYSVGNQPYAIALGDMNGDGATDLMVANYFSSSVSLLLNLGAGSFGVSEDFAVPSGPVSIALGDFDSDSKIDIAAACRLNQHVYVWRHSCALARLSAENVSDKEATRAEKEQREIQATISPNPVEDLLQVRIDGAGDGPVRLWLTDLQGRTVADQTVQLTSDEHQATLPMGQSEAGMYLLRISTATENKTLKVLKR